MDVTDTLLNEAIPAHGFIRNYVEYARTLNPAVPLIYHIASGYGLASSLMRDDARIPIPSQNRPTTIWPLIVGLSGVGKSTAIMIARDLFTAIMEQPPEACPSTAQGLYKSAMIAKKTGERHPDEPIVYDAEGNEKTPEDYSVLTYWEDDMGKMLADANRKQGHGGVMRAALLHFYDGAARKEVLATKEYNAPKNRTTLVMGVTPAQMAKDVDAEEWKTGFFSRFMFFYYNGVMGKGQCKASDEAIERFRASLIATGKLACAHGEVQVFKYGTRASAGYGRPWYVRNIVGRNDVFYDDEAARVYQDISAYYRRLEKDVNQYARGPIQRATDMTVRTAAILQWSQPYYDTGWRLTAENLRCAFALSKIHAISAVQVADLVAADNFNILCSEIAEALTRLKERDGICFATQGMIHRELQSFAKRYPMHLVQSALHHEVAACNMATAERHLDNSGIPETVYSLDGEIPHHVSERGHG